MNVVEFYQAVKKEFDVLRYSYTLYLQPGIPGSLNEGEWLFIAEKDGLLSADWFKESELDQESAKRFAVFVILSFDRAVRAGRGQR